MRIIEVKANPYHDNRGRFAPRQGGPRGPKAGAAGGSTPKENKPTLSATERAKLRKKLEAAGSTRGASRADTLQAYHDDNKMFDKYFTSSSADQGGVHSLHWDSKEKPPKGYPKGWPTAPRNLVIKQGDFSPTKTYKPPMSMKDINNLHNMGEHGRFAARVMMNELYNFGRKRQGTAADDAVMYSREKPMKDYFAKHGLSSMNWEWHHMLPAARGGSNSVKNVVVFNGGEHTLAHQLEAAIVQERSGKGFKAGNMGLHDSLELATAIRAQNNVTKQLGSAAGYLRNGKFGGKEGAAKKAPLKPKELKALEDKWNKSHKNYISIAIKAGVWKKGSRLMYNKVGVDYGKDAANKIRLYLLQNPIKPFDFKD